MNQIKIILFGLLVACFTFLSAQESDQKIVIEITKDIDGERKTFKGTYDSEEEMRADPNYQEFSGDGESNSFWFSTGDEDIVIHLDQMSDVHKNVFRYSDDNKKGFFFHLDDDSSSIFDFHMDTFDTEALGEKMKRLGIVMSDNFRHLNLKDEDSRAKIIDSKKIKVTDVDGEFGRRGKVEKKEALALENLSFYPNSSGKLKIRFETLVEDELSIKVSNLDGKDVFNRYFESFSGGYSETIDLSGQKEGIYLLEIIQGKKKVTKKVIIN